MFKQNEMLCKPDERVKEIISVRTCYFASN
jgi:hypothetical protein